jgi:hypothetical protein
LSVAPSPHPASSRHKPIEANGRITHRALAARARWRQPIPRGSQRAR